MVKLTIHTATYNRAYILSQAYESLKAQTCKDFEWIITDDGSNDGTDELVRRWIDNCEVFPIVYDQLPHVGLPRALNSGVQKARSEWYMRLDSDDYLKSEAVEKILNWISEIEKDASFVGVGFARCFPDGRYMKNQIPVIDPQVGYIDATNIERPKYRLDMDMCEASRVDLFKQFPFQAWTSETFAPEQLNYNEIALAGYKYRWRAEKLYVCQYLPDGQTRDDGLVKRNPMGFAMMHNQNMKIRKSFKEKCKCAMQMTALCIYAGHVRYLTKTNCFLATLITFPLGIALSFRRQRQYAKIE